jgi:hypothetical protein
MNPQLYFVISLLPAGCIRYLTEFGANGVPRFVPKKEDAHSFDLETSTAFVARLKAMNVTAALDPAD